MLLMQMTQTGHWMRANNNLLHVASNDWLFSSKEPLRKQVGPNVVTPLSVQLWKDLTLNDTVWLLN